MNGPIIIFFVFCFFFFVILFYIERKWLLMRNEPPILPLKFKFSRKFQLFIALNRSIEMLKIAEFSNISIQMKKCKTFCKTQIPNRLKNFIQSPPPIPPPLLLHEIKHYYVSKTKFSWRRYIEIYRYLLSKYFKNAVLGCQEMMQCKYSF